jgi:hypothetical protein
MDPKGIVKGNDPKGEAGIGKIVKSPGEKGEAPQKD